MARHTLVGWDRGRVDAVAKTHDDSSDDELGKRIGAGLAGHLDDDSDCHDDASQDHGLAPAEQVAHPEDEHGAHQTADLVDCSDQALHGGIVSGSLEDIVEGGGTDDAAHHTVGGGVNGQTRAGDGRRETG